jgi:hypothetical protein
LRGCNFLIVYVGGEFVNPHFYPIQDEPEGWL